MSKTKKISRMKREIRELKEEMIELACEIDFYVQESCSESNFCQTLKERFNMLDYKVDSFYQTSSGENK